MIKKQLGCTQTAEIVEDSEPEREEYRKRRKEESRRRKGQLKTMEVIELTDSDSHDSVILDTQLVSNCDDGSRQTSRHERSVYAEMMTPDLSGNSRRESTTTSTLFVGTAGASAAGTVIQAGFPDSQTQRVTRDESDASNIEAEERTNRMRTKIGSFVFSASSQTSSIAGTSSRISQKAAHMIGPTKGTLSRQGSVKAAAFYLGFSERQLKLLSRCVSCDLKWTVRKSAANKVSHMRTCAKKARFTEETMDVLLSREIKAGFEKARKADTIDKRAEEPPPKTYLEHIVKENVVLRPTKRQKEFPSTVKAISESRDDIRNRAKTILGRPSFGQTARHGEAVPAPSTTQTLGQSRLGSRLLLVSSYLDDDELGPPLTQSLPGSKLGTAKCADRTASRTLDLIVEPPSPNSLPTIRLPDDSRLLSVRRSGLSLLNTDLNADVVSPYHSAYSWLRIGSLTYLPYILASSLTSACNTQNNKDLTWEDDDCFLYNTDDNDGMGDKAVLIFDPEIQEDETTYAHDELHIDDGRVISCSSPTRTPTANSRPKSINNCIVEDVAAEISKLELDISMDAALIDNTPFVHRIHTKKTSSPIKRNAKRTKVQNKDANCGDSVINEEELFQKFRSKISEDETLYLRVLRYEPIRLDVFMALAQEHVRDFDLGPLGLKIRLREFLDRQLGQTMIPLSLGYH
ncbi:hypothetical protein ACEPAI_6116 [Sanghuangporus weigelae]